MLCPVVCQHLFFRKRIVVFSYVVQVQAIRIIARLILEKSVAILCRTEARAQYSTIQRRPIDVLDALHRVRLFIKRHVRAPRVLRVSAGVRRAPRAIHRHLQL